MPSWFIDSLDARAGIAFASLREGGFALADEALQESWSVLIEPPSFEPQTVGSGALAMAASRQGFQVGLFRNPEVEVEFRSLDALKEFVRRLYVRGSGGDDPDPADLAPPLPSPEAPLPNLELGEPPSESDRDPARMMWTIAQIFASYRNEMERTDKQGLMNDERDTDHPPVDLRFSGDHLARAALILIADLLQRQPRRDDMPVWNQWAVSSSALVSALDRLHVWPLLVSFDYQLRTLVESVDASLAANLRRYWLERGATGGPAIDALALRHVLRTGWIASPTDVLNQIQLGYPYALGYSHLLAAAQLGEVQSPAELLESIVIPTAFARGTIQDDRISEATLQHLLAAFIASPQVAAKANPLLFELVLFATTLVASANVRSRAQSLPMDLVSPTLTGARDAAIERAQVLVRNGLRWLIDSLPGWVFDSDVETMIVDALGLAYRSERLVAGRL